MAYRATGLRIVLGASLGFALVGATGSARAADDGYQNVFSSVLGAVGLMPEPKSGAIDYRELPPLVLPPKQELVKPSAARVRTAAWPQDPDVIARRKAEEEDRAPIPSLFDKSVDRPDSKAEMMKHRAAQTDDATPDYCRDSQHGDAACRLTAGDMRRQDALYRAANPEVKNEVTAGVEPERLYLTQPPKGYLKATKTVKATAEAPQPHRDESSPLSSLLPRIKGDDEDSPN